MNSAFLLLLISFALSSRDAVGAESLPSLLQQIQGASQKLDQRSHCPDVDPPRPYKDDNKEPKVAKDEDWLEKKIQELNSEDFDVRVNAEKFIEKALSEQFFAEDFFNLNLEQKRRTLAAALDRLARLEETGSIDQKEAAHKISVKLMKELTQRLPEAASSKHPMVMERLKAFHQAFGHRADDLLKPSKLAKEDEDDEDEQDKRKEAQEKAHENLQTILNYSRPVTLGDLAESRSLPVLRENLRSGSDSTSLTEAAAALIQRGPQGVEEVKSYAENAPSSEALDVLTMNGIHDLEFAKRVALHSTAPNVSANIIAQAKGAFKLHPEAKVLPFVEDLLASKDEKKQELAYEIIAAVGDGHENEVVPFLLKNLHDKAGVMQGRPLEALAALGPVAAKLARPALEGELKNAGDNFVRRKLAVILAKAGFEGAIPVLEKDVTGDSLPDDKSLIALGYAGEKGREILLRLREKDDPYTSKYALYGLVHQGPEGLAEVRRVLKEGGEQDIGQGRALEALEEMGLLDNETLRFALLSKGDYFRSAAEEAAERTGISAIAPLMIAASDEVTDIRQNAAKVLEGVPRDKLLKPLIEVLRMKELSDSRKEALSPILARIPASQKEEVRKLLSDPDPIVRKAAEYVLRILEPARDRHRGTDVRYRYLRTNTRDS